jgi:hypothetical protein
MKFNQRRNQNRAIKVQPDDLVTVSTFADASVAEKKIPNNRELCNNVSDVESQRKSHFNSPLEEAVAATLGAVSVNANRKLDPLGINSNLILALERTFFSSLNNAWLLAFGGVGLLCVGKNEVAIHGGVIMITGSLMLIMLSTMFHFNRARQIENGIDTNWFAQTKVWAAITCGLTLVVLSMEIYFALKFPYLDRTWSVKVGEGADETNS